jgi:aspartokinase
VPLITDTNGEASGSAQAALQQLFTRLQQQQVAADLATSTPNNPTAAVDPTAAAGNAAVAAAESAAKAAVERIRACEFGAGLALQGAAGRLMAAQNARLGRALQRLSQDLYSSNTHFVLELVQVGGASAWLGLVCCSF